MVAMNSNVKLVTIEGITIDWDTEPSWSGCLVPPNQTQNVPLDGPIPKLVPQTAASQIGVPKGLFETSVQVRLGVPASKL